MNQVVQDNAPFLFQQVGGKNPDPADPWLIAVAKVHGYTVVTNEKATSTSRIPAACRMTAIDCPCINGAHFLLETGLSTTSNSPKSQHQRFLESAKELECDEDEKHWDERLKKLAKAKPAPEKPE